MEFGEVSKHGSMATDTSYQIVIQIAVLALHCIQLANLECPFPDGEKQWVFSLVSKNKTPPQ